MEAGSCSASILATHLQRNNAACSSEAEHICSAHQISPSPNSPRLLLPPQVRVMLTEHHNAESSAEGLYPGKDKRSQRARRYREQAIGVVADPDALSMLLAGTLPTCVRLFHVFNIYLYIHINAIETPYELPVTFRIYSYLI
jgi:hypothetical protein